MELDALAGGIPTALAIAAVADLGLIVYLLAPGHMSVADGTPGPVLSVAGIAYAVTHRTRTDALERTGTP